MNLYIDPAKAWAANPVAAKKYNIPKPASYTPAAKAPTGYVNITPAGLATYQAAQAAGKTYVAGQGYVAPAPTPTYYDLAAQLAKSAGWVSPTYAKAQPTEADYLKRKAEAERVTGTLRATPTQAYVQGQGYVPYQPGLTPSYQEQLDRVAALKNQYSWLGTGQGVTAGATPIETWQPAKDVFGQSQQGQSLLSSLQDWMGKAGQAFKTPLLGGVAQAQGLEGAAPKAPAAGGEKGFTPEEWASMGRPLGGAYAGYGGVPPSGLEMAQTAVKPGVKYWWEGGTMMGAPTPEQLNTPEYMLGYLETSRLEKGGLENAWDMLMEDIKEGYYTPEQISKDPKAFADVNTMMLLLDKYDQKWFETLREDNLYAVIGKVIDADPSKLPPTISEERLNAIENEGVFGSLYDLGYRSLAFQDAVNKIVATVNPENFTSDALNSLKYANALQLAQWVNQLSDADKQKMQENGGRVVYYEEFLGFNLKGEPLNKGGFQIEYPPQSEMTKSAKELYIDQQQFYNEWYWSDEATAQRQKEREEWSEYQKEKELEGWKEYYAILDTMKLYPDANDYWSYPDKFAELRRKWETSGAGLSWDAWLQQFDFEGEWYALPPQERGEKKYVYSPRMIRLNY